MKTFYSIVLGGFLLALSSAGMALDVGESLPRLSADRWFTPRKIPGEESIMGIVLLDVTSPDAPGILALADTLAGESFHGKKVYMTVFALNNAVQVRSVAGKYEKARFAFGLDSSLRMRRALAPQQSLFPYAMVAARGKIVWNGLPAELSSVIEQVASGKFSLQKQKEIEGYRKEMSIGIQSALPAVVISSAEKILEKAPDDLLAIQAKIFSLNALGKKGESYDFLRKKATAFPGKFVISLLYLEELLRLPAPDMEKELDKMLPLWEAHYAGKREWILLIASILEKLPFGVLYPEKQLSLAASSVKVLEKSPHLKNTLPEAIALETLAKASHFCGRNASAVIHQKRAVMLRKNTPGESLAKRRLLYYESALKAGKK